MTGTKSVTRANTWKNTSKATGKAVKKLIPHAAKHGKDSSGFNLSYYSKPNTTSTCQASPQK